MTRSPGWEGRLRLFLNQAASWKFDPVRAHCAHFILGVLEAITERRAAQICDELELELPHDEAGVDTLLLARGGMRGIAKAYFGAEPRTDMLNAREGDIAVLDGERGETLGIVEGGGVLCVASDQGLMRIWLHQAKGFWVL